LVPAPAGTHSSALLRLRGWAVRCRLILLWPGRARRSS